MSPEIYSHTASRAPYLAGMLGKTSRDVGEIIAHNIKKLRKARGLTQTALADRSGVSQTMISAIERNETSPAADTLQALAKALGAEIWQLQMEATADDILLAETLPKLINDYSELSPEDRQAVSAIVARLSRGT